MDNEANDNEKSQSVKGPNVPSQQNVTYGSYLKVPELLNLQQPLTSPEQHDETLFIIIHQVYELWFKQIMHEVAYGIRALAQDELMVFVRILGRIRTIQRTLTTQVEILETMTPADFNQFRERLNPASGFQSYQFRELEFRLGAKDPAYFKFYRHSPEALVHVEAAYHEPTLYDAFLRALSRRGLPIPAAVLERDVTAKYVANDGVKEIFLSIYRNPQKDYQLYLALEAMIDMDEGLLLWRQRHVAMVERMIGSRHGTGGSSGVSYLNKTLVKRFFPEIWLLRNHLGEAYGLQSELPDPSR